MSGPPLEEILIIGVTAGGETFRLGGCMWLLGEDQRISHSPYLTNHRRIVKCVVVDRRLEQMSPNAFTFLMAFFADNEL